ncbi:MAG TPA: cell division protein FtsQ/DivIB, partial [Gammaproteobacteria bacterium]|nr:cell division protein FtsQ/DivIB [Gammaproteobacteria bacterium]
FSPGSYPWPGTLPYFIGPDGTQGTMLQFFNDFNRELLPLHAKITSLELTPYQLWHLTLDNGIRLHLGHKNILTHLSQFVKVYPKIIGNKVKDVEYVDLRYPNGMAVKWKESKVT